MQESFKKEAKVEQNTTTFQSNHVLVHFPFLPTRQSPQSSITLLAAHSFLSATRFAGLKLGTTCERQEGKREGGAGWDDKKR